MNKPTNILVIHGYEMHCGRQLGPLAQAVCAAALPILKSDPAKRAILLGGWRLKEATPIITIADGMALWLMEQQIPAKQIITPKDFSALKEWMPARDFWEEIVLLRKIFNEILTSIEEPFSFLAWNFHIPRLMRIYNAYGFTKHAAIPVTLTPYKGLRRDKRNERIAHLLSIFDPAGVGIFCFEARMKRTLAEGKRPLIP